MKKYFAVIMALTLASSVLTACGTKESTEIPESTTVYSETTVEEVPEITDDVSGKDVFVSENVSVADNISSTVSETAEETNADSAPLTVEEIVAYFNESINKIKPTAKKVVKNYEKRTVNEEKVVFPSGLESTAENMIASFMKDDNDPIVYETREDITNEFIVPEQSYSSRLTPEWVKSATIADKGSQYVINLKLKDQNDPSAGNGIGAVCDVIEVSEVAEKASFVKRFSTVYYNCEIIATIDKASGNVVHIRYITPVALEMTVNMFGTHDCSVGFTFEKDYSITY